MTYFHVWYNYSQPELDNEGNKKLVEDSLGIETEVETGFDIRRHVRELTKSVKTPGWEGRRFLSPQQLSVNSDTYSLKTKPNDDGDFDNSDNPLLFDIDFWSNGDLKYKVPQRGLPGWDTISGKIQSYQLVRESKSGHRVNVFDTTLDINKFLNAKNDKKRFNLLTSKDDTIVGSSSDDILDGGKGNDYILGRGGSDILRGGKGSDVFGFDRQSDSVIKDFEVKNDKILLPDFSDGGGYIAVITDDGLEIKLSQYSDPYVTLEGVFTEKGVQIEFGNPREVLNY